MESLNNLPEGIARDSWLSARNKAITEIVSQRYNQECTLHSVTEDNDGYEVDVYMANGTLGTEMITHDQFMEHTSIERKLGL